MNATAAKSTVARIAVRHVVAAASAPRVTRPSAMPRGQVASMTPSAVASSRPANQSVTIFVSCMLRSTPPAPLASRAPVTIGQEWPAASPAPPSIMRPRRRQDDRAVAEPRAQHAAGHREEHARQEIEPDQRAELR